MVDEDEQPDNEIDQPASDAGDKRAHRKRKLSLQFQQRQADEFWNGVLSHEVGRREIWRLLNDAHAFEERFACGPNGFPQPEATWFHAGEQAFALRFYHTLAARARDLVLLMHDENDSRFPVKKK